MVKKKLVEELIHDGAVLLHELERRKFPVESMFWLHLPDQDYWRLVVASTAVSQTGSTEGYRQLNDLMRSLNLAGITLEDVSLLDPNSGQFQSLLLLVRQSSPLASGPEWLELEDAVVYRWTGASITAELGCELSSDEVSRIWETERQLINLPALLVRAEKNRVTLRFHPQHGSLPGIENLKKAFQFALHRSHPDCEIRWD